MGTAALGGAVARAEAGLRIPAVVPEVPVQGATVDQVETEERLEAADLHVLGALVDEIDTEERVEAELADPVLEAAVGQDVDTEQLGGGGHVADKFFCPFCEIHRTTKIALKEHIADVHIQGDSSKSNKAGNQLNKIRVPTNQERISRCNICGKVVNRNDLEKHMKTDHKENSKLDELEDPIEIIDEEYSNESSTLEEIHEIEEKELKVVMIKQKTLWWPAKVLIEDHDSTTVILLNKKRTRKTVTKENVKPFLVDHSQIEGMKRHWRDAYMKGVKLVEESQSEEG